MPIDDLPEDTILRSYATLGSLASAVRDKAFLEKYFKKINHSQYQFFSKEDYPDFRIRLLNCSYKKPEESYKDYLHNYMLTHNFRPEVIGVSATSCQIEEAEKIAYAARTLIEEVTLIIGGSHVTIEWKKFLKKSSYDIACIGEGVETFCELSLLLHTGDYQNLANIRGLAYKNKEGEICFNGYRNPVMELDEYPFPSDSLELFIEKPQQYTNYYIQLFTGIGCCKNCTFCAQRAIHRGHIRSKSAEKIMEELENLTGKGFRKFLFIDEEFAANRERLENFLKSLEERKLGIKWAINARADSFDKKLLERMRANGCINIQVGVETGDQVLLDLINKDLKLAQVQDLCTWCNEIGIRTSLYFMIGLPDQDWQSIFRTAVFIKNYPPTNNMATLFITLPLPGTRTARKIKLTSATAELANLPKRFPELHFENGIILGGESGTETASLTSGEIAEAYFLLYGLSSSIWFSNPANRISLLKENAARAREGAEKCLRDIEKFLYVIKRRVIRDLIIKAFAEDDVSLRHKNYREILENDKEQKETIKDFALLKNLDFSSLNPLDDFLLTVKFENGFSIMKLLSAADRIIWMEFLASLWKAFHKNFVSVRFADTGLSITAVQETIAKIKDSGATGNALKDIPGSAASDREKTVYNLQFRVKDQTCLINGPESS